VFSLNKNEKMGMANVLEHLPSKREALRLKLSTTKKKKRERERESE
jgi:hypothetical protein